MVLKTSHQIFTNPNKFKFLFFKKKKRADPSALETYCHSTDYKYNLKPMLATKFIRTSSSLYW